MIATTECAKPSSTMACGSLRLLFSLRLSKLEVFMRTVYERIPLVRSPFFNDLTSLPAFADDINTSGAVAHNARQTVAVTGRLSPNRKWTI